MRTAAGIVAGGETAAVETWSRVTFTTGWLLGPVRRPASVRFTRRRTDPRITASALHAPIRFAFRK